MIERIRPVDIKRWHLQALAASLHAAPPDVRHSEKAIMYRILSGEIHLYEVFTDGFLAVHKDDNRLVIDALSCRVLDRKKLAEAFRNLASQLGCDMVQTTVFDRRLADAIIKVGGKIESYDIVLDVEAKE